MRRSCPMRKWLSPQGQTDRPSPVRSVYRAGNESTFGPTAPNLGCRPSLKKRDPLPAIVVDEGPVSRKRAKQGAYERGHRAPCRAPQVMLVSTADGLEREQHLSRCGL